MKLSNHHFINIQTSFIHQGMTKKKSGRVSFLMVKTTVTKSEICFKKLIAEAFRIQEADLEGGRQEVGGTEGCNLNEKGSNGIQKEKSWLE